MSSFPCPPPCPHITICGWLWPIITTEPSSLYRCTLVLVVPHLDAMVVHIKWCSFIPQRERIKPSSSTSLVGHFPDDRWFNQIVVDVVTFTFHRRHHCHFIQSFKSSCCLYFRFPLNLYLLVRISLLGFPFKLGYFDDESLEYRILVLHSQSSPRL